MPYLRRLPAVHLDLPSPVRASAHSKPLSGSTNPLVLRAKDPASRLWQPGQVHSSRPTFYIADLAGLTMQRYDLNSSKNHGGIVKIVALTIAPLNTCKKSKPVTRCSYLKGLKHITRTEYSSPLSRCEVNNSLRQPALFPPFQHDHSTRGNCESFAAESFLNHVHLWPGFVAGTRP